MRNKIFTLCLVMILVCFNCHANQGDPLSHSMYISSQAMKAHGERLKIISQNLANIHSLGSNPGEEPYKRQVTIIKAQKDKKTGALISKVKKHSFDKSPFKKIYDPKHPAANDDGYVLHPNMHEHVEVADSKDALRSYQANLGMIESSKNMFNKTLEILK